MLKAVQSTEPRWLRLHDAPGWGSGEGVPEEERQEEFMRRVDGLDPAVCSVLGGGWRGTACAGVRAHCSRGLDVLNSDVAVHTLEPFKNKGVRKQRQQ
jgi:hypothetical protein